MLPELVEGTVRKITDGDTIHVALTDGTVRKVRLVGIDAPEMKQPYGEESRRVMRELIPEGTTVLLDSSHGTGRFGRTLAHIYLPGENENKSVSLIMVERGAAWYFDVYHNDPDLAAAQESAKQARLGLWASETPPEKPSDYRKRINIERYKERSASKEDLLRRNSSSDSETGPLEERVRCLDLQEIQKPPTRRRTKPSVVVGGAVQ